MRVRSWEEEKVVAEKEGIDHRRGVAFKREGNLGKENYDIMREGGLSKIKSCKTREETRGVEGTCKLRMKRLELIW